MDKKRQARKHLMYMAKVLWRNTVPCQIVDYDNVFHFSGYAITYHVRIRIKPPYTYFEITTTGFQGSLLKVEYTEMGFSKCNPADEFDYLRGIEIAAGRACYSVVELWESMVDNIHCEDVLNKYVDWMYTVDK